MRGDMDVMPCWKRTPRSRSARLRALLDYTTAPAIQDGTHTPAHDRGHARPEIMGPQHSPARDNLFSIPYPLNCCICQHLCTHRASQHLHIHIDPIFW
jgi:hypothetical protein